MKYTVEISKEAKEDLYMIYRYIAYELLAKETALHQIERIEKGILSLDEMPERHRIYDASKWQDLRMLPVDNYCIFYIVNHNAGKVNIARVLYGKRDFDTVFGE
ncbi:type II toxin-antitoxin system RelE/ParE family toxin [Chakrabartyella piscis]|uniref:type II toxin-antitoxin system RelE/ParE family toxin n=1 Tax=Chakrabartyella piscis TaxID=2918914 RepID=UPI002958BA2F|nr:type II toxin-antitoxin system RelE/ParE family toxin [Chakrabartyella piscis]